MFIDGVGTAGSSAEGRLWGISSVGTLLCLDTATQAVCAGQPSGGWNVGMTATSRDSAGIAVWDGRIYMRARL